MFGDINMYFDPGFTARQLRWAPGHQGSSAIVHPFPAANQVV